MDVPDEFLKTVESIVGFAQVMTKLKSAVLHDGASFTQRECQDLMWAMQVMQSGWKDARRAKD